MSGRKFVSPESACGFLQCAPKEGSEKIRAEGILFEKGVLRIRA